MALVKMDFSRIFTSGTSNYVASNAQGIRGWAKFKLILKHFFMFLWASFIGMLLNIRDFFWYCCSSVNLKGKVVVVTGGANGLGREICLRLAHEHCQIAVVDINYQEAERTANDLGKLGTFAKAYKLDVANFQAITSLHDEIINDFDQVDILINNVGLLALLTLTESTCEQVKQTVAVNVTSVMLTTKIFLADMERQGSGHIVCISSPYGLTPSSATLYGTTLYAIRGFMACLNQEILINNWQDKIKTLCAFPFFMTTRMELGDYLENLGLMEQMFVVTPTEAAAAIVSGIKSGAQNMTIPSGFYFLMHLMGIYSARVIRRFYRMAFGESTDFP